MRSMARRKFLAQLAGLPFLSLGTKAEEPKKPLKIMMKSAWGPDDPTRAAFPFAHGLALAEAGHEMQIFFLLRPPHCCRSPANAILLVVVLPLCETHEKDGMKQLPT